MTTDVLERIADAFVALDRAWRYTYVNRKAGEIFGRRPEDLVGRHIWTEFPEGVGQPFHQAYERAVAEQKPLSIEEYYAPWNRWFENRIYPSPDGIAIFFTDVTERHLAAESLRRSEERLRLALAAARQGLYDLDIESGRAVTTPEYATMLGYDPSDFEETNARWIERLHPDDRERVSQVYADYIAGRRPEYRVEFRQRTRSGGYKWILSLGKIVERGADGRPRRMLGTHTDISAEKYAEQRVSKLTRLYAALSDTNQAIVREHAQERLLQDVCRVAVERGGLRMAWIGMLSATGRLEIVARHGAGTDYVDRITIAMQPGRDEGRGPTARAIRSGVHQVVDDIHADPAMRPWWDEARRAGFRSSAAFPLRRAGSVVGALNLYAAEPGFFDDEMIRLLDEMAADLSMALDRFSLEAERDATIAELRTSNARLLRAEANAGLGSWELEVGAARWNWSEQTYRLFGLEPRAEAPTFEECLELVHPEDQPLAAKALERLARGEQPPQRAFRTRPAGGPARVLWPTWTSLHDAAGRPLRFEGTLLDVTERHAADQALQASERRYRELFEANPHPMWVCDLESLRFLAVNDAAVAHYGYARDEFLAMTIRDIRPTEDVPRLLERVRAAREGLDHAGLWRHVKKDGSLIDVEITTHGVAFGERRAEIVLASDVTERRRAEAALAATLAALPDLLFEMDAEGRILDYRAPQPEALFDPTGGFVGRTVAEVLPAPAARVILRALAEAAVKGTHRGASYELPMPGGPMWFELSIARKGGLDADEDRFVALARDVTERLRSERRLRLLSRRVLSAQEQERRRIARELHDEIGQALTAVKLDIQSLARAPAVPSERLGRSLAQVDRVLQEVRALSLDLRPPLLEELGLAQALRGHVARRAGDAGLEPEIAIELPAERVSPELEVGCYRIVQEAVTNVLRHAEARRLWLTLSVEGGALRIVVEDDGRGFEWGGAASAGASAGLRGMQERVDLLGGRLEIRARQGGGTEVAAWLPLHVPEAEPEAES